MFSIKFNIYLMIYCSLELGQDGFLRWKFKNNPHPLSRFYTIWMTINKRYTIKFYITSVYIYMYKRNSTTVICTVRRY